VRIPNKACCKGHSAPGAAFCDAYFARSEAAIWKAARGLGGKSFMLAVLSWMESVTLRASVTILGGSGEQSARVQDYSRSFWLRPNVPYDALRGDPTQKKFHLAWGNVVEAQLASQRSVRGAHPQRMRMDEADEIEWRICEAARGQAMTKGDIPSHVVYSSTHQNADGTMTKLLMEAAQKGWPVFEWCYRETLEPHGWLTPAAMERYKQQVSAELWRVEVELGEPSPEGRAIMPECVEKMFSLANEKYAIEAGTKFRDDVNQYFEFEPPIAGAEYAHGVDWGKTGHETVIWTNRCDCYPIRMVAYEHLKEKPMPWMIERLMLRLRKYPGDGYHDATGVGTYHSDSFTEVIDDYLMVGKKRNDLFQNYITGIENNECTAPRVVSAYNAHKYARNRDLFTADQAEANGVPKGHPPDPLVAGAMAYAASLSARHPLSLSGSRSGAQAPLPGVANLPQNGPAQSPLRIATSLLAKREPTSTP
jgi:hypothetical protein